jgi:hypothetical protein
MIRAAGCLLLLAFALSLTGCETPEPMVSSNGKKLKLQTVTHDGQTNYVYREVNE